MKIVHHLIICGLATVLTCMPLMAFTEPTDSSSIPGPSSSDDATLVSVIVKLEEGTVVKFEAALQVQVPNAHIVHRYDMVLGGVSLVLRENEIDRLKSLPGVKEVYPDKPFPGNTNLSPKFIHAVTVWNKSGELFGRGEGVIIGVLDSGIWPEHPSFSDPDPSGEHYPAPPTKWKGICEPPNDSSTPLTCNNKLIGARAFLDTYKAVSGLLPGEPDSARDVVGHGTHVASIAAGNSGIQASLFGIQQKGALSGIAPRAHLAIYRTGSSFHYHSDVVAAIQQAVIDGVDVINMSIAGCANAYTDPVALAFRDAYKAGIFVAVSSSPDCETGNTIGHTAPWITSVGVTTLPRRFVSEIQVSDAGKGKLKVKGASLTSGIAMPTPVTLASELGDEFCGASTSDGAFEGRIVVCKRGEIDRTTKSNNVKARGAVGMILVNTPEFADTLELTYSLPTVHLDAKEGEKLLEFLASHSQEKTIFSPSRPVPGKADRCESTLGGATQTLGVSKPDLSAPGAGIIAAMTPQPIDPSELQGQLFSVKTGTSMASPHVAGAAALLKGLNPNWTPGQIKSALMTSTVTKLQQPDSPKDPFFYCSGRLDLAKVWKPGLTFDVPVDDFQVHQSDLWNTNYPSIYVPKMPTSLTIQRTAHNEQSKTVSWRLSTRTSMDLKITTPPSITIPANGTTTFGITIDAHAVPAGEVRHAALMMEGPGSPHLPITIVRGLD